jgi:hypothetical protein
MCDQAYCVLKKQYGEAYDSALTFYRRLNLGVSVKNWDPECSPTRCAQLNCPPHVHVQTTSEFRKEDDHHDQQFALDSSMKI